MNRLKLILSVALLLTASFLIPNTNVLAQQTIVVPSDLTNVEGNIQNRLPISCTTTATPIPSLRYQQVYAADELMSGSIIQVSFRLDQGDTAGFGPIVIPDIQIDMTTTDAVPGALSATFADNLGTVVETVFFGNLTVQAPDCLVNPCPFDVQIPLQNPYTYDPADGNLLIDVRVNECVILRPPNFAAFFNASSADLSITSRATTFDLGNVNSPTAQALNDLGLVTQFTIVIPRNVPTLSEWGLIAMAGTLGLVGFVVLRRKKITA